LQVAINALADVFPVGDAPPKVLDGEAYEGEPRKAAGIDGQSIEDFERDLSNNLYRESGIG
jgi:hypothetical protein